MKKVGTLKETFKCILKGGSWTAEVGHPSID